jgi:hypothetical protein
VIPPSAGDIPLYEGHLDADLKLVSRNRLAEKITGGLSITQKMPCPSFGIPATRCKLGELLAHKEGSICHPSNCYAKRGRYRFSAVQRKLEERYRGLFHPLWTPAMVFLIRWYCDRYFRWMDSGDLQGETHLRNIRTVAEHTPEIQHWLPTREAAIVRSVEEFPGNLTVRLSGHWIDGKAPDWPTTSTVAREAHREASMGSHACPSRKQGNRCDDCRACWDGEVGQVVYTLH